MQASQTSQDIGSAKIAGVRTALQFIAIVLIALVAGSTFGIWRGYAPDAYSALTFLETHQGAVRGLNLILPLMGGAALVQTGILAVLARRRGVVVWPYLAALVLMAVAAIITRFANQPINAQIMTWLPDSIPANWTAVRDSWWAWHVLRMAVSVGGLAVLILAVFIDRGRGQTENY